MRTPVPPGGLKVVILPADGVNFSGMLGVDAAFDGVSAMHDGAVQHVLQALARGQQDLALHQVHVRDHFRDRMLHLDARVHLDEVELAVFIHQEFDGAGVHIADVGKRLAQDLSDLVAQLRASPGWRAIPPAASGDGAGWSTRVRPG